MKRIDKKVLPYIILNVCISSFLTGLLWYLMPYKEGILSYIGMMLFVPGFFLSVFFQMIFMFKSSLGAVENSSEEAILFASFLFYSIAIGFIQWIYYRRSKRKQIKK